MVTNTKEYQKEYYKQNSVSCECECGGKFKKYFKTAHDRTQLHQNYINEKEKPIINKKKEVLTYVKNLQERIKHLEAMAQEK